MCEGEMVWVCLERCKCETKCDEEILSNLRRIMYTFYTDHSTIFGWTPFEFLIWTSSLVINKLSISFERSSYWFYRKFSFVCSLLASTSLYLKFIGYANESNHYQHQTDCSTSRQHIFSSIFNRKNTRFRLCNAFRKSIIVRDMKHI